jgi:hypothetical protein
MVTADQQIDPDGQGMRPASAEDARSEHSATEAPEGGGHELGGILVPRVTDPAHVARLVPLEQAVKDSGHS